MNRTINALKTIPAMIRPMPPINLLARTSGGAAGAGPGSGACAAPAGANAGVGAGGAEAAWFCCQATTSVPHLPHTRSPGAIAAPQLGQFMGTPPGHDNALGLAYQL